MTELKGKKVFVGLSGGVDSSVTAALLQEQGALVRGVFIQGWYPPDVPCTWKEDRADAMRVAAHLGIPFSTYDASAVYKKHVIDYLLAEYKAGRTPNPDIMCNKEVKFGAFYHYAKAQGADFVATGHYAQSVGGELFCGVDPEKDQSYFLWAISKELLPYILFPLGALHKEAVRERARTYRLPTALKKDSQGICFLGNISMDAFLSSAFTVAEGDAYSISGEHIGTHKGAVLYTLGERVPITGGASGPWFVIQKDIEQNRLYLSHTVAPSTKRTSVTLSSVHYLATPSDAPLLAEYRYHGPRVPVQLDSKTNTVSFDAPLREALAPGQSLVIYQGEKIIAGGIIET